MEHVRTESHSKTHPLTMLQSLARTLLSIHTLHRARTRYSEVHSRHKGETQPGPTHTLISVTDEKTEAS